MKQESTGIDVCLPRDGRFGAYYEGGHRSLSMSVLLVLGLCVVLTLGCAGRALIRTGSAFLAELRNPGGTEPGEVRVAGASLADAEAAVIGAQDGLRTVRARLRWELLGFGDLALRQRELVNACGELQKAQRSIREVHRRSPFLALDPGADVGLVEDPLRALALRGLWFGWFSLMLLPGVVRRIYTFVVLRRALVALVDTATDLEDQLTVVRRSAGERSLPSRSLGERLAAA